MCHHFQYRSIVVCRLTAHDWHCRYCCCWRRTLSLYAQIRARHAMGINSVHVAGIIVYIEGLKAAGIWLDSLFCSPFCESVSCFVNDCDSDGGLSLTHVRGTFAERVALALLNTTFLPCPYSLNLYELIKKNNYNGFSMSLIRRFCNSIVKCLRLLYKENIIHCDLKPVSVLDFIEYLPPKLIHYNLNFRKTSCSNSVVAALLRSSTLAAHAMWIAKSTRTSNRGSIAPRRWFSACNTAPPSICGAWVSVCPLLIKNILSSCVPKWAGKHVQAAMKF